MIELPAHHRQAIRDRVHQYGYQNLLVFERCAGFPRGDVCKILRGPVSFGSAYMTRFLDQVRDLLGLYIPRPDCAPSDVLAELHRLGHIRKAECDAGMALKIAAEGFDFPGLFPSRELLASWPARLRAMYMTLRSADSDCFAIVPPLPTCTSTIWGVAVDGDRPAALGLYARSYMARLEMVSLRMGLKALSAALPTIMELEDTSAAATDAENEGDTLVTKEIQGDGRKTDAQIIQQALVMLDTMPAKSVRETTGLSEPTVRWLARIRVDRADLLSQVLVGDMTIYSAALEAGYVKRRASQATGKPKGVAPSFPPKSEASWKLFNQTKAKAPELAARVERCELTIFRAAVLAGVAKPTPPRQKARPEKTKFNKIGAGPTPIQYETAGVV